MLTSFIELLIDDYTQKNVGSKHEFLWQMLLYGAVTRNPKIRVRADLSYGIDAKTDQTRTLRPLG